MARALMRSAVLRVVPSFIARQGMKNFDAAVRAVEVRRDPGQTRDPLGVHADSDLRGHGGIVDAFRSDRITVKPGYVSVKDSAAVALWQARYPGIEAAVEQQRRLYEGATDPVSESPTWGRRLHPVSVDRVVSDFLQDGATETFCALPSGAQKIVALKRIAEELKFHPEFLAGFADLAADTLRSVGARITYEINPCDIILAQPEELNGWENDAASNEFWHELRTLMEEITRTIGANFERVAVPGQGLKYYVAANRVAAVVGPYGCPMPIESLRSRIYGFSFRAREVVSQVVDDGYDVSLIDADGKVIPYAGERQIMTIQGQLHSVLESGVTLPIPEKTAANAYCVESGRRCFVEKSGDTYHFIIYSKDGHPELPTQRSENHVIFNKKLYLRQTDGRFTLAADGYYPGRRLWKVAGGRLQEVSANARDSISGTRLEDTEVFFDPVLRQPIAFWDSNLSTWAPLKAQHKAYNPVYNEQRYFVPEGVDGRYYTSTELEFPHEALKKMGPAK